MAPAGLCITNSAMHACRKPTADAVPPVVRFDWLIQRAPRRTQRWRSHPTRRRPSRGNPNLAPGRLYFSLVPGRAVARPVGFTFRHPDKLQSRCPKLLVPTLGFGPGALGGSSRPSGPDHPETCPQPPPSRGRKRQIAAAPIEKLRRILSLPSEHTPRRALRNCSHKAFRLSRPHGNDQASAAVLPALRDPTAIPEWRSDPRPRTDFTLAGRPAPCCNSDPREPRDRARALRSHRLQAAIMMRRRERSRLARSHGRQRR